ncbi:cupredoxin domain-containing protein [Microvirga sp. BT688]|uniref:cupredoxin domain-containing protein n=1 Tax=Microvirga sp. TaxID=1873136 RepID=UPI0016853D36|nr:cupredoxin domain-containing protein [Microvirga sp.]MBD2750344.1 cupredoxin domain-containing protein [Microvirga sp.]
MDQMMTRMLIALIALVSIAPAAAQQTQTAAKQGPSVVHINLHEWGLGLDGRATVPGNEAVFEIRNTGSVVHSFEIEGKIDGKEVEVVSGRLQPGQTTSFTLRLPAGEYTAYCPVGNHRERGMLAAIVFRGYS